ncbi:UvrD-helicase domain-containing protein [Ruegeria sp.]|uniref:UvrD-helicase domain-containing protein n=1 Tax=Ruegeria sp. TaxID=1879320 RepID=UPI003B00707C
MQLTEEQQAIEARAQALAGSESLKVIAYAGTGKTTTLRRVAESRAGQGAYLAFNRSIAREATGKLHDTGARVSTMHALALRAVRDRYGPIALTATNANALRDAGVLQGPGRSGPPWKGLFRWGEYRFAAAAARTVSAFCASADAHLTEHHARKALIDVLGDPKAMGPGPRRERAESALGRLSGPLTQTATAYFRHALRAGAFGHDIYLKLADLSPPLRAAMFDAEDYILIDEAQDLSPVQRAIVTAAGCPVVAVGDPYQQIYSWRGAENALGHLPGESLYLTGSFRFGPDIAALAGRVLHSRPDQGPMHPLRGLGSGGYEGWAGAHHAVLCRTNAGVIDAAGHYLRRGFAVWVDRFDSVVADMRAALALQAGRRMEGVSGSMASFWTWSEFVMEARHGTDAVVTRLCEMIQKGEAEVVFEIDGARVRTAAEAQVVILTCHRAKGMEWPAVQLWDDFGRIDKLNKRYNGAARKSQRAAELVLEEWNILYVAVTRAVNRVALPEDMELPE